MRNRKLSNVVAFLVVGVGVMCSGCASIISKAEYPVTIQSVPSGADVTVFDERSGKAVFTGTTPTRVTLKASAGFFKSASYRISASMQGVGEADAALGADLDGWYIANILFGGLIGLLIVDPATGAMYKLQDEVVLNFEAAGAGTDEVEAGPEEEQEPEL